MHTLNVLNSVLTSVTTGWRGTSAGRPGKQPSKLLELYEYEGCPYCRRVRQVLTELSLDVIVRPCPKGGMRFRPQAEELGGKQQFPLLLDPNTEQVIYESSDIIAYLYQHYGNGRTAPPSNILRGNLGSALRLLKGSYAKPSTPPERLLELYSFESSPYSRLVRERLSEMELPYILRNMGKGIGADMGPPWVRSRFYPNAEIRGNNRIKLHGKTGRLQVPYLIDANSGSEMFESKCILEYLDSQYGAN